MCSSWESTKWNGGSNKECDDLLFYLSLQFREVFGKVLGGNLSYDQMTMLFMKIDANSDGTVDWDEFSTYMMTGSMGSEIMVRWLYIRRVFAKHLEEY
jgi:hypothetical protein